MSSYPYARERAMPIHYEHAVSVGTTPERAFAVIDDPPLTAKWLPPRVSLAKVGDGPNAPGDKLRYVFRQGGRHSPFAGDGGEGTARPSAGTAGAWTWPDKPGGRPDPTAPGASCPVVWGDMRM